MLKLNRKYPLVSMLLVLGGCAFDADSPEEIEARQAAAALSGEPVGTAVAVTYICSGSQALRVIYDVFAPAEVEPGETFQVQVHAQYDLAVSAAPFSGTSSSNGSASASEATPGAFALSWTGGAFTAGDRIIDFGDATFQLTAGDGPGPIEVSVDQFNYTFTRDGQTSPAVSGQCPIAPDQLKLVTIDVAGGAEVNVPTRALQCLRFRQYTDGEGNPFASRRACLRYVLADR